MDVANSLGEEEEEEEEEVGGPQTHLAQLQECDIWLINYNKSKWEQLQLSLRLKHEQKTAHHQSDLSKHTVTGVYTLVLIK